MPDRDREFLELILAGDRAGAALHARQDFERRGVRFLFEDVVRSALAEVGRLWSSNRISVADEHLATATAQAAVASLYPRFPWPAPGPRALVGCPGRAP